MPKCIKCNYELVLLSNRQKYKCAICSRLYHKKGVEAKEFRTWNKWQRELDIKNNPINIEKEWAEIMELRRSVQ